MENGWISLHRKLKDKGYYKKSAYVHLWIHILLSVNRQAKEFMWNNNIIVVKEGQMITGRKELASQTGISESSIERILNMLETEHQIQQQKTTKYRLITIVNWKKYQTKDTKPDSNRTATGQQPDTNNNNNNINKGIGEDKSSQDIVSIIEMFSKLNPACKRMYGNTTQRKACKDLIDTYSLERVLLVIEETLPKTNKMTAQFFPNISTPLQLFEKWQKLEDAIVAYRSKKQIKSNNVIW